MIRMIDATELKTAFPSGEYVRTECVQATIDHMQTIDAIPVEWLEEHDSENISDSDGNIYGRRYITISEALSMWQKEQEAR